MKTKQLISLMTIAIVTAAIFASCSKDGATGPAGPAGTTGAAGAAGIAGATGANGAKGDTGTANVIYSDWFYTPFADDGTGEFRASVDVSKIDSGIVAGGDVRVYVNLGLIEEPVVYPLPYTANDGGYVRFSISVGSIAFESYSDLSNFNFRYVIIPGSVAARSAGNAIDWNDYSAVKRYLKLKD